jgi:hypothetical protein
MPLKDQFGKKSQGSNLLSQLNYLKFWKQWILQAILLTPRLTDAVSRFRIWISPRIRSQNRNGLKGNVRDLGKSDLCKNIGKTGSLPCPFKHGKLWRLMWFSQNWLSHIFAPKWRPLSLSRFLATCIWHLRGGVHMDLGNRGLNCVFSLSSKEGLSIPSS